MLTSLLVPFVNSNVTFGKEGNRASCQKNATQVLFIPFAFCDKKCDMPHVSVRLWFDQICALYPEDCVNPGNHAIFHNCAC